jgi:quinol monooxygenase YgiN
VSERVVIFTRLTAQPGRRAELLAVLEALGHETRAEPGNEVFVVHLARDEPDVVLGYEVFRDEQAVTDHRVTDAVRRARERLPELLAEDPTITYARG